MIRLEGYILRLVIFPYVILLCTLIIQGQSEDKGKSTQITSEKEARESGHFHTGAEKNKDLNGILYAIC